MAEAKELLHKQLMKEIKAKSFQCTNCGKTLSPQYPTEDCSHCNEPMCMKCWYECTCCGNCFEGALAD